MATAAELAVDEEYLQLSENAKIADGWIIERLDSLSFLFGFPAKGGQQLWVKCTADDYPTLPPVWRWCGPNGTQQDEPQVTAIGGSAFFHGNGVICAPWNRLAYTSVDSRGPHSEWTIGNWKSIPETKACTSLAAMAIRLAVEGLQNFAGMKG